MSQADIAVAVRGLSKSYTIAHNQKAHSTLAETMIDRLKNAFVPLERETFWAVDDVSFDVRKGDVVGIIGRNGAGKSTLLKILSRITEPTKGEVHLYGRVGSLLEVGTGFHPELTGRENIFLNGAILGMAKADIRKQFDAIVDFAEIAKFLDTPVKRYSSGMYVRLAFAVAAHLEPEILIVDEVLAVGDTQFQKKCMGKMGEVAKGGRTILFVSHNMAAIQNLCSSCIFLRRGRVELIGSTKQVTDYYLRTVLPQVVTGTSLADRKDRSGSGVVRFTEFHVEDSLGNVLTNLTSGSSVDFVFRYHARGPFPLNRVDIGFSLHTEDERTLFVLYSSYAGQAFTIDEPDGEFRCRVDKLPISAGRYRVGARVTAGVDEADWPRDGVGFVEIIPGDFYGSGSAGCADGTDFLVDGRWSQ